MSCPCSCGASCKEHCWNESNDNPCDNCGTVPCYVVSLCHKCWLENKSMKFYLECNHCGDVAIEVEEDIFYDGDGDKCISCGFPGHVTCDMETDPYWQESDYCLAKCNNKNCEECPKYSIVRSWWPINFYWMDSTAVKIGAAKPFFHRHDIRWKYIEMLDIQYVTEHILRVGRLCILFGGANKEYK